MSEDFGKLSREEVEERRRRIAGLIKRSPPREIFVEPPADPNKGRVKIILAKSASEETVF